MPPNKLEVVCVGGGVEGHRPGGGGQREQWAGGSSDQCKDTIVQDTG